MNLNTQKQIKNTFKILKKRKKYSNRSEFFSNITEAEYISDYYGYQIVPFGDEPDINTKHKHGYIIVDVDGNVVNVVSRINENYKWDWYKVGNPQDGRIQTR